MCEVPIKNEFNIEKLPFLQYSVLNLSSCAGAEEVPPYVGSRNNN